MLDCIFDLKEEEKYAEESQPKRRRCDRLSGFYHSLVRPKRIRLVFAHLAGCAKRPEEAERKPQGIISR
jgi:hypothetical protein